jgi:hypothetical protein
MFLHWPATLSVTESYQKLTKGRAGVLCTYLRVHQLVLVDAMRPRARGLAQHGGPPGWLEESELAGVILYVMDRPCTAYLFRIVPVALTGAA